MFVFVGGVGPSETSPKGISDEPCPSCGACTLQEKRVDQVLSMFFVPLMTVHKGRPFRVCRSCGWDSRLEAGVQEGMRQTAKGTHQGCVTPAPRDTGSPHSSVEGLHCLQCGHAVQDSFLFCPFCGSYLN